MHNDAPADNCIFTVKLQIGNHDIQSGRSGFIGNNIPQVAGMPDICPGGSMGRSTGIEMIPGRGSVRRTTVTESMDMEPVRPWRKTVKFGDNPHALPRPDKNDCSGG